MRNPGCDQDVVFIPQEGGTIEPVDFAAEEARLVELMRVPKETIFAPGGDCQLEKMRQEFERRFA